VGKLAKEDVEIERCPALYDFAERIRVKRV
jgi:hypothetical protein